MNITVKVDYKDAFGSSGAKSFKQNMSQVRFATALALTRTAQDAQAEVRRQLPTRFTIRNAWVGKGIRINAATKQNLEATIYSIDNFMVLQEKGGSHVPREGRSLSIPMDARKGKTGIVTQANRVKAMLAKPGVFRKTIGGLDGLWQRLTRISKAKRGRGHTLKLLFVFKPSVPVRARFGFVETVRKVAQSRMARQFAEALRQAVRTAR